jgi:hypothetical protein
VNCVFLSEIIGCRQPLPKIQKPEFGGGEDSGYFPETEKIEKIDD